MKKAIIVLSIVGLSLVSVSFYYAEANLELSRKRHSLRDDTISYSQRVQHIENRIQALQVPDNQLYKGIELEPKDFSAVHACLTKQAEDIPLDNACKSNLVDVFIKEIGAREYLKGVIGLAIGDYVKPLSSFTPVVFIGEGTTLTSAVALSFMNRYRAPQKLRALFEEHKRYFFNITPKSLYIKLFDPLLTELIGTYETIEEQDAKEAYFETIYFKAETQNLHREYWTTTFWKRRMLDGNDKEIYSILKEIKENYKSR